MNGMLLKSRNIWIGLTLSLVSIIFSACQADIDVVSTPTTNQDLVATMVAATLTAWPSSTPKPTATQIPTGNLPGPLTYVNATYGFAFDYSQGWHVTETIVPAETRLTDRSLGRFDIEAGDSDFLLVDAVKGSDWILEIDARKLPSDTCPGGYGPQQTDSTYQPLEILGRNAARLRPEDGVAWIVPEPHEPYTLPVVFYKLPTECIQDWPDSSIPTGEVVFLWGYSDNQMPLSLSMTYYSNQFTAINLQNRTIDYATIQEMDQIVQSLRLLAHK